MLLPALGSVKATAKGTTCSNNLKQLNLMAHLYADTYNGMLPFYAWGDGGNVNTQSWFDWYENAGMATKTEMKKQDSMYRCPTTYMVDGYMHHIIYGALKYTKKGGGKAEPFGITEDSQLPWLPTGWDGTRHGIVNLGKTSGRFPLYFDSTWNYTGLNKFVMFHSAYLDPASASDAGVWLAHREKANMTMADGSVSTLSAAELKVGGFTSGFSSRNVYITF